jgi:Uma2 family endonuclease
MIAALRPLTYDDLRDMPNDGRRYEVIGGELLVNPAPRRDHQEVVANLDWILQRFLRATGMGRAYTHPVDVQLGRNDIVQPDLVVIRESRLDIYQPEGTVVEPPDVVVEIVSPSSNRIDRVQKMALYARSGVPESWIVASDERTLVLYTLQGDEYVTVAPDARGLLASQMHSGLRLDPNEVYSGLS